MRDVTLDEAVMAALGADRYASFKVGEAMCLQDAWLRGDAGPESLRDALECVRRAAEAYEAAGGEGGDVGSDREDDNSLAATRPARYCGDNGVECKDAIRGRLGDVLYAGFCIGTAMRYEFRFRSKGGVNSLRKAADYLGWAAEAAERAERSGAVAGPVAVEAEHLA